SKARAPRQGLNSVYTIIPCVGRRTPLWTRRAPRYHIGDRRGLETFWDLTEVDLRQGGADELRLVGLGMAAPLELGDHGLQVLDVLVVERDTHHLVVCRLLFDRLFRRRVVGRDHRLGLVETLEDRVGGERVITHEALLLTLWLHAASGRGWGI